MGLFFVQFLIFPHEMLHWLTAWALNLHPKYDARKMMVTHEPGLRWQSFLIGVAPFMGGLFLLFISFPVLIATYPNRMADLAAIGVMVAGSILLGCGSDLFQVARLLFDE